MKFHLKHAEDTSFFTKGIEKAVYGSRLLLIPLYLGLIAALGIYACHFMMQVWDLCVAFAHGSKENEILTGVVNLLDIVMIANLIVMILIGSYSTFVSELKFEKGAQKPQWLNHISAGILKTKMAASIVGVSSIHLLQVFVKAGEEHGGMEKMDANTLYVIGVKLIIHIMFIVGLIALYQTSKNDVPNHDHAEEPAHSNGTTTQTHEEATHTH